MMRTNKKSHMLPVRRPLCIFDPSGESKKRLSIHFYSDLIFLCFRVLLDRMLVFFFFIFFPFSHSALYNMQCTSVCTVLPLPLPLTRSLIILYFFLCRNDFAIWFWRENAYCVHDGFYEKT